MKAEACPVDFEAEIRPLWLRAQAGDEDAYKRSLTLMAARLRAYFRRRMSKVPDDVEDLVQETLLVVHLQRGTYDPTFAVSAWFTAIARHKLVDLWRRRGRLEDLTDEYDDADELNWAAEPQEGHALRDLGRLLQELPELQRQAIELTKLEGLSVLEASERTGVSPSAIKVQVHRGLKRLAELVKVTRS
jgi:RNA polymerase sigma-70 factor (ECF subfamily)